MLTEGQPKVAIIGPSSSSSVLIAGQIVPVFHTVHMSCVAVTAEVGDKTKFPTLFMVNQADNLLNPLSIKMMKYFGWSRIATLAYQDEYNVPLINGFLELVQANDMTLLSSAILANKQIVPEIIATFKAPGDSKMCRTHKQFNVRIILGAFHADIAVAVFCEAYKQGLYGPSYVWILFGTILQTYANGWMKATKDCTLEQIKTAANGHFSLHNLNVGYSNETTISGKTASEEMSFLETLIASTPYKLSSSSAYVTDTAWSLALGINNSLKYLEEKGLSLSNYNYSEDFSQAIIKGIQETSFVGVSGALSFDETHGRIGVKYIKQVFAERETIVAYYDLNDDTLTWVVDEASIWTDGRAPRDSFTYLTFLVPPSYAAAIVINILNTFGCISTLAFLVYNTVYRNNWSIKMSSPYVNNVIIVGCLMMYSEVYLDSMDYMHVTQPGSGGSVCMSRTALTAIGFTLLFGGMFSKTYRVHLLFRDQKIRKKFIKDRHLYAMILVMILIDFAILIPWSVMFPFHRLEIVKITKDSVDKNLILQEIITYCDSEKKMHWLVTLYVYKGILLAFGTFIAWETRHVTVPELNDSKYIGACIYNVVVVCFFGVPLAHVLPIEQKTVNFVLESCLLIFCTTICACIIFVPKIKNRNKVQSSFLHVNPSTSNERLPGKQIFNITEMPPTTSQTKENTNVATTDDMKSEIKDLRHQLTMESIALAKLRKSLLVETGNLHFYKSHNEYVVFKSGCSVNEDSKATVAEVNINSLC